MPTGARESVRDRRSGRSRGGSGAAVLLASCFAALFVFGTPAQATSHSHTLADLVAAPAGFRFDSVDGTVSFGNFEAIINGSLSSNLSEYTIETNAGVVDDGFQMFGAIGVSGGNSGSIRLEFDVFSNVGSITGAEMFFNGRAVGGDALAEVTESFAELMGLNALPEMLRVFAEGGGASQLIDAVIFANAFGGLHVVKEISVDSNAGILASISIIDQRFSTAVPEPGTAWLLGAGLFALAIRRRSQISQKAL